MRHHIKFLFSGVLFFSCISLFAQTTIVRGPYLQVGTSTSIIIKWNTSVPTDSQVKFGLAIGVYSNKVKNLTLTSAHELVLNNLLPNTKYYYTIGSTQAILQGDNSNYFTTYPSAGTDRKLRFWVTGDCGNNSDNQRQVRDQYLSYAGSETTDGWLLLGDNAYFSGLLTEYDDNFFSQYQGNIMKRTVLWPAPGNHDYGNNPALQTSRALPYYDLFTVPTQGEAGGISSQSKSYYSYNIGNTHFISLDSYGIEDVSFRLYDTLSAQVAWLKKDLAANQQTWTIAYWHHPPYTKGSHNSDGEDELIKIRENLLRILERGKVDLVMCGHSHSYERSKLLKGHYNFSTTFDAATMNKSTSSAQYTGTTDSCPYIKHADRDGEGIVYVVAGSAGQLGGTVFGFPHPAMHYSNRANGGSLILEIEQNRLDVKWLCADGVVRDSFTMMKDVNLSKTLKINYGDDVELAASWKGNYEWNKKKEATPSIVVSPRADTTYVVRDNHKCLADTFKISVDRVTAFEDTFEDPIAIEVFPNPSTGLICVELLRTGIFKVVLSDLTGRIIATQNLSSRNLGKIYFDTGGLLPQGVHIVTAWSKEKVITKKVILK
jgi:acid phosphatase type 7